MQTKPNNRRSNHFVKKKVRKVEYTFVEDSDYEFYRTPETELTIPGESPIDQQPNAQYSLISLPYDGYSDYFPEDTITQSNFGLNNINPFSNSLLTNQPFSVQPNQISTYNISNFNYELQNSQSHNTTTFSLYTVLDNNNWKTLKQSDATSLGECKYRFSTYLDIDYWGDYLIDYKVKVIAIDGGGNSVEFEQKVNGLFGGVLEFLASVWNALVNTINAAVNMVMKALDFIVEWILGIVRAAINTIIAPIVSAIDSYVQGVLSALMSAYDEYSKTGKISDATLNAVNSAFMGPLYWVLVGISVAILAALTIAMPFTITFGFLIGMILSLVVTAVMAGVFSSTTTEGEKVAISPGMGIQQIFNFAKSYAENQRTTRTTYNETMRMGAWAIFGVIVGMWSFILGGAAYVAAKEPTGYVASAIGLIASLLSLIFSFAGLVRIGTGEGLFCGILAIFFGVEACAFGAWGTYKGLKMGGAPVILGMISFAFGLIGIVCSLESLR